MPLTHKKSLPTPVKAMPVDAVGNPPRPGLGLRTNPIVQLIVLITAAVMAAGLAPAEDDADPSLITVPTTDPVANFVRFYDDGHGGGQMQSGFASYRNEDGVQVDILPTVHVGEPGFFRQLAKRFPKYDAVLYELVAPRGQPATEEGVSDQQRRIANDCNLENQGPHVNYDRKNFVHADLDLEEIQKLEIAQNGTFKGALGDGPGLRSATSPRDTAGNRDVFNDLHNAAKAAQPEQYRLLRRAYARILVQTARPAPGSTYPPTMEVLVGARNDKVMKVLADQIADGKKKLAIMYGAAHAVDMEHRLFGLGFKRVSLEWQVAWTVAPDGTPTTQPRKH